MILRSSSGHIFYLHPTYQNQESCDSYLTPYNHMERLYIISERSTCRTIYHVSKGIYSACREKVSFFTENDPFPRSVCLPHSGHLLALFSLGITVPSPAEDPNQAFYSKKTSKTTTIKNSKPRTILLLNTSFESVPLYLLLHSGYTLLNVLLVSRKQLYWS